MENQFAGIIPARMGSKTIKNKNTIIIKNKPLVEFTFKEAKKSKLAQTFVLTDSLKIKKIASKYKINTDYIRPLKVSRDKSSTVDTLIHFLKDKKINFKFKFFLILLVTSSKFIKI